MKTLKPTLSAKLTVTALALAFAGTFSLAPESALANSYGTNITINDDITGICAANVTCLGVGQEDNEAEPGMVQSQAWDLEGFFLKNKQLTIAGGYNFVAGPSASTTTGTRPMRAGDIFIDTNGYSLHSPNKLGGTTASYQDLNNSDFKYDYVLDINWDTYNTITNTGTYQIYKLTYDDKTKFTATYYGSQYNTASNPWRYLLGGTEIGGAQNFSVATATDTGFSEWNGDNKHYVASFDLSLIQSELYGALFHNTMECGNDNLMGRAPVPEPATMLLFGAGIAGLAGIARRRRS